MYRQLLYLEEKFKVKKNLAVALTFHPYGTREDEDRWKIINFLRVQEDCTFYVPVQDKQESLRFTNIKRAQ